MNHGLTGVTWLAGGVWGSRRPLLPGAIVLLALFGVPTLAAAFDGVYDLDSDGSALLGEGGRVRIEPDAAGRLRVERVDAAGGRWLGEVTARHPGQLEVTYARAGDPGSGRRAGIVGALGQPAGETEPPLRDQLRATYALRRDGLVERLERGEQRGRYRGRARPKVLVVLTEGGELPIRTEGAPGRREEVGTFLIETIQVLVELDRAGYDYDFATPRGGPPLIDVNGMDLSFYTNHFLRGLKRSAKVQSFVFQRVPALADHFNRRGAARRTREVALARDHFGQLRFSRPLELSPRGALDYVAALAEEDVEEVGSSWVHALAELTDDATLARYQGLLVPGGHGPMVDLHSDPDLGAILAHFHVNKKPTALICHGPLALMSAVRPVWGGPPSPADPSKDWLYSGRCWLHQGGAAHDPYTITVLSTREEQLVERFAYLRSSRERLGSKPGRVPYYVDALMEAHGIRLANDRTIGASNLVFSGELITGQNPASVDALAVAFVDALRSYAGRGPDWVDYPGR